jgi:hypothetical protein
VTNALISIVVFADHGKQYLEKHVAFSAHQNCNSSALSLNNYKLTSYSFYLGALLQSIERKIMSNLL